MKDYETCPQGQYANSGSATRQPLLGQQGQGDATRQQSLAEGILGDGRPQPVAAFRQGLKGAGRGVHAVVTGVLGSAKLQHNCSVTIPHDN